MPSDHNERVQAAFTAQAATFEDSRVNRTFTQDARWLFERLECRSSDLLLDVAAGTGHAARELSSRVRVAVAIDVTPAMLAAGSASAREEGVENVIFQRGDAASLPFVDGSFDVIVSRFALHHMEAPELALREMTRCLRPGGRMAIADMVSVEDHEQARAQNRVEIERDHSHTRMLSVSELVAALEGVGLYQIETEVREIDRPLEPWIEQSQTEQEVAEAIRRQLRGEIAGGAPTGMRPYEQEGTLRFCQTWACVSGRLAREASHA
jgi:ubiquinone/menaquinone biosynthesis C-methylase UbiE